MPQVALTDVTGIGEKTAETLREAGIDDAEDLVAADPQELAEASGLTADQIRTFQSNAREELPGLDEEIEEIADDVGEAVDEAVQGAQQTAARVGEAIERDRVVLSEKFKTARVKLDTFWHEEVPILTAKAEEEIDNLIDEGQETAVVLREQADVAWVKIEGEIHENLPIFKRRVKEVGEDLEETGEEIRVRVHEVRDRAEKAAEKAEEVAEDAEEKSGFSLPFGGSDDEEDEEADTDDAEDDSEEEEESGGFSIPVIGD